MKKIIFLIAMLLCITGCNKTDSISDISFTNIEDCNNKLVLLTSNGDINIYTYCIKNVKVNVNNRLIDLKKYIKKNKNSLNNIMSFLPYKDDSNLTYDVYKGSNIEMIKLIKCYSSTGNEDVYIGNGTMNIKKNFCEDNNYTFVRTYYVENIQKNTEGQFIKNSFKVKLKDYKGNIETIILNDLFTITLEKNRTYEFEFMLNEGVKNIDNNTNSIFDNSTIIDIRETTKTIKE